MVSECSHLVRVREPERALKGWWQETKRQEMKRGTYGVHLHRHPDSQARGSSKHYQPERLDCRVDPRDVPVIPDLDDDAAERENEQEGRSSQSGMGDLDVAEIRRKLLLHHRRRQHAWRAGLEPGFDRRGGRHNRCWRRRCIVVLREGHGRCLDFGTPRSAKHFTFCFFSFMCAVPGALGVFPRAVLRRKRQARVHDVPKKQPKTRRLLVKLWSPMMAQCQRRLTEPAVSVFTK